jgi:uncharacterized lipoprotein YajG
MYRNTTQQQKYQYFDHFAISLRANVWVGVDVSRPNLEMNGDSSRPNIAVSCTAQHGEGVDSYRANMAMGGDASSPTWGLA